MSGWTRLLPLPALLLAAAPAWAQMQQSPDEPPGMTPQITPQMQAEMHLAAHNQLGILEYCQQQGFVGADAVQSERRQIAAMPSVHVDGIDQAEIDGRQGTVEAGGQRTSLLEAAEHQGITVRNLCNRIGDMLRQQQGAAP